MERSWDFGFGKERRERGRLHCKTQCFKKGGGPFPQNQYEGSESCDPVLIVEAISLLVIWWGAQLCLPQFIWSQLNFFALLYFYFISFYLICAFFLLVSVVTVFRSTQMTTKTNGVATNLFCTGVIGHPGCMFLSQGPKSLTKNDITGLQNDLEILSSGVQLRVRKDQHPHDARSRTVPIRHMLSSK